METFVNVTKDSTKLIANHVLILKEQITVNIGNH